jgi:hypothetical protein
VCERDPKPSAVRNRSWHSGGASGMSVALRSRSTNTTSASGHAAANSRPAASADRRGHKLVMTFANLLQACELRPYPLYSHALLLPRDSRKTRNALRP